MEGLSGDRRGGMAGLSGWLKSNMHVAGAGNVARRPLSNERR